MSFGNKTIGNDFQGSHTYVNTMYVLYTQTQQWQRPLLNYFKMTSVSAINKPASVRIRGQNVGSPLKGWEPLDPTTAKLTWYFKEIMLGLVICFTQTPETIGFALTAHVDPSQVRFISNTNLWKFSIISLFINIFVCTWKGLHSAWILGTILAVFGGRPAMITGFSGASARVCFDSFCPHRLTEKRLVKALSTFILPSYSQAALCFCLD